SQDEGTVCRVGRHRTSRLACRLRQAHCRRDSKVEQGGEVHRHQGGLRRGRGGYSITSRSADVVARLVGGCGCITRRQTRRKAALLVFIAAFAPQAAATAKGGIKVLNAIPDAYWGTWTPGVGPCKDGDTEAIVLSAKAYAGPLGKCD